LFAERAVLKLLELSKGYEGVRALRHMERARRFKSIFSEFKDIAADTVGDINDLCDEEDIEDKLVRLFWKEMGRQIVMPEAQARITVHLPDETKPNALFSFELGPLVQGYRAKTVEGHKRTTLPYLKMAPFELKGATPGFADDIAIFDLKPTEWNPNPIDLRPYSQFITAGTTITFYYPAQQHEEWFIFSRPYRMPPDFILDKKLQIIFAKQVTPEVNCVVYGVEAATELKA
jgi:hypothetical protein